MTKRNELKYVIFKTNWGFFGLLANERGLLRTSLPLETSQLAKKYLLVGMFGCANKDNKLYPELQKRIKAYYKGSYVNFSGSNLPPICLNESDFACKVLKVCKEIPLGQTITYSQLAKRAGFPKAARATGNILAKNLLPLIVPCHRVIRNNGKIGNFSAPGGGKTKKKMIEYEKQVATKALRHKVKLRFKIVDCRFVEPPSVLRPLGTAEDRSAERFF
jgi:methylated-DNA-[protein]-cysteine S-methyltransferase